VDSNTYPRLIEKTIAEFGSIDILVNNAGVIRRAPPRVSGWILDELDHGESDGGVSTIAAGRRHMLEKGNNGKIVNIARCSPFKAAFSFSIRGGEGGVAQLTKALANAVGLQRNQRKRHRARIHDHRQHRSSPRRSRSQPPDSRSNSGGALG